jgi:hypothetical protein
MFDNFPFRTFCHSEIQTFEHLKVGKVTVENLAHSDIQTFQHLKIGKVMVENLAFEILEIEL